MPPRHDSASDITLPRATSLLGTAPPALRDPFADEITLNQRADEITVNRRADDVTVNRRAEEKGGRWHIELELDADQIARLHRLGLAHDAVVWRDGLPDWRPLLEAYELREAIEALKARAPSSMKSALRRATIDRIANMSRPAAAKPPAVSPRRRTNTDPALRLYAALNRRRPPQDSIEFAPAPKIVAAPVEAPVVLLQRDSLPPVSAPIAPPRARSLLTFVTHVAVALITAGLTMLFWVGPLPSPATSSAPASAVQPAPSVTPPAPLETKPNPPPDAPISVQSLAVETPARAPGAEAPTTRAKPEAREHEAKPAAVERAAAPTHIDQSGPDRGKIARALAAAAGAAADCGVGGSARVVATFGPSGVVRRAAFEGPLPELTDRSCVLRAISRARIPAFSGDPITVRKTVSF